MIKFVAASIITFFAGLLFFSIPAHAVDPVDITIAPTATTIAITPGKTSSHSFQVLNSGSKTMTFSVSAQSYYPETHTYNPIFGKETTHTQLHNWVTFTDTVRTIEPGKVANLSYSVRTPTSIPDGAQYMVVFAETAEYKDQGISSKKRVGMLVYAHPTAGKTIQVGAATFANLPFITQQAAITSNTVVENTGNTDFHATVTMKITSALTGAHIATLPLKQRVFPTTERPFDITWNAPGLFGLYRVTLTAQLPHANSTTSSIVLFISPLMIVLLICILAVAVAAVVFSTRWRKHAKARRPSSQD